MFKKILFSALMASGLCNCSSFPRVVTREMVNLPHTPPQRSSESVLADLRSLSEPKTPTKQTQAFQTNAGVCPSQKPAYFQAKRQRDQ
jgi:hypothetical protein